MYAIIKQTEASEASRGWAEMDEQTGAPIIHRTRAGAEQALAAMVPAGKDPWAYAGLRIEEIPADNLAMVSE
jgi:hypothetical protein